ncbi:MAG: hypothetical protein RI601_00125 [Desulfurivibrionaceae bacterium]|nr:hypothetical protein [Desulfurivibrionaceae bacterium]
MDKAVDLANNVDLSFIHRAVDGDIFFLTSSGAEFLKTSAEYVKASEPYVLEIYKRL